MLHVLNKKNTTNTNIQDLFCFKICYVKKIRSTSNENIDQFLFLKKFKSASNEDANQFDLRKI